MVVLGSTSSHGVGASPQYVMAAGRPHTLAAPTRLLEDGVLYSFRECHDLFVDRQRPPKVTTLPLYEFWPAVQEVLSDGRPRASKLRMPEQMKISAIVQDSGPRKHFRPENGRRARDVAL